MDLDDGLSVHCVETDWWDRQSLHQMSRDVRPFRRARKKLSEFEATGHEAMEDAFWLLNKAVPTLLPPKRVRARSHVNWAVIAELASLSATKRLRLHSVGDPMAAAMACVTLEPALEAVFDRLSVERAMAEELEILAEEIEMAAGEESAAEAAFDLVDADDEPGLMQATMVLRAARDRTAEMQERADRLSEELSDRLEDEGGMIRMELREAATSGAEQLDEEKGVAAAWGLEPGELTRMAVKERMELARRLNTERMRKIAELFGRIRNLALSDAALEDDTSQEEIYDLELGDDLSRVVPAEFLTLDDSATENAFFARYADRALLQYAMEGKEELGRGGIIMCVDGSGSMDYNNRELWAKAVMLVLLHLAREQRRAMHVVHFGGPGQVQLYEFTEPAHFSPDRIIDAATVFFRSGTDFETPMQTALGILQQEFAETGRTRADVVFATDDECWVSPTFMGHYLAEMHRMRARTWGLAMGARNDSGPLAEMSEGRVKTVRDLTSGHDIKELLRGTR